MLFYIHMAFNIVKNQFLDLGNFNDLRNVNRLKFTYCFDFRCVSKNDFEKLKNKLLDYEP